MRYLVACGCLSAVVGAAGEGQAQEATGAGEAAQAVASVTEARPTESLASRADQSIYVVQRRAYSKSGDVEITPVYFTKINPKFVGYNGMALSLAVHLKENLALELLGALPFGFYSDLVVEVYNYNDQCQPGSGPCQAFPSLTPQQVDLKQMTFFAGLGLQYSAFYGKFDLSVLGADFLLDYDFYATGGFDVVTTVEPCRPGDGGCSAEVDIDLGLQTPLDGGDSTKLGGHLGGGMRVFFHDLVGLRIEVRDLVYSDRKVEEGAYTTDIRNEVLVMLGLSLMLPVFGGGETTAAVSPVAPGSAPGGAP